MKRDTIQVDDISEQLIPMDEAQVKESINRLTNICALVLGWELKTKRKFVKVADVRKDIK